MDIATIMKAVQLVGETTPAAKALFEGFIAATSGGTQTMLKQRYEEAKRRTDELHGDVQREFGD